MQTYEEGAQRSDVKPRYDLLERLFLTGTATVLGIGAERYGEYNWQKGDRVFANDCFNHLIEHLYKWKAGDRSENHLYHAACNLMFMCWFADKKPEYFEKDAGES